MHFVCESIHCRRRLQIAAKKERKKELYMDLTTSIGQIERDAGLNESDGSDREKFHLLLATKAPKDSLPPAPPTHTKVNSECTMHTIHTRVGKGQQLLSGFHSGTAASDGGFCSY